LGTKLVLNPITGKLDTVLAGDVEFDSVQTGTLKTGDITGGNYSGFEADGTLVFKGNAKMWRDIDFPIIIRNTGTGVPTLEVLKGNITAPQWAVNDYNVCEAQEMVHEWFEGSEVHWHIHVITNGVNTDNRYIRFEIETFFANLGAVLSAVNTWNSGDLLIPANTPDRTHLLFSIKTEDYTGGRIGRHAYTRLRRIASTGTAPTANPFCSMLQMHIEMDTTGSRNISSK